MTLPRQVLPGKIQFFTRRCLLRMFLLRPDKKTRQAFEYCLALAAERFSITVLCYLALSNHYHLQTHDAKGLYPKFLEYFHSLLARVMNRRWGRRDHFFEGRQTSVVECVEPEDAIRLMAYTLANPADAGLVARPAQWPGARSLVRELGTSKVIKRPDFFFGDDSECPEEVTLRIGVLPELAHLDIEEYRQLVSDALEPRLKAAWKKHKGRFLGPKKVQQQSPFDCPRSLDPRRGGLSPTVAAGDKWARLAALQRKKEFLQEYRDARARWLEGDFEVVWPAGTWWYRMYSPARVAET